MKLNMEIRELVSQRIADNPEIQLEEIMRLLRTFAEKPDTAVLLEREYRMTARRILNTIRDTDGVREVYALNDDACTFINVARCRDIVQLDQVCGQLAQKVKGLRRSMKKIKRCRTALEEQLTMEAVFGGNRAAGE